MSDTVLDINATAGDGPAELHAESALPVAPPAPRLGSLRAEAIWGLLDQISVSGVRFVTTVMVLKAGGSPVMGLYYLAWSIFLIYICCQESLITTPYTVFVNRMTDRERQKFVLGMMVATLGMATLTGIGTWLFSLVAPESISPSDFQPVAAMLAISLPGLALREYGRRVELAHGRPRNAFVIDTFAGIVQLGGLAALYYFASMTAGAVWAVVGFASAASGILWLAIQSRDGFAWDPRFACHAIVSNWRFGMWVFLGQVSGALLIAAAPWILELHYDKKVVGVYGACMTVILFANPFVLGFGNILGPRACKMYRTSGFTALRKLMLQANLVVLVAMTLFGLAVMLLGEPAMHWAGKDFRDFPSVQSTLFFMALLAVTFAFAASCSLCLAAVERPDLNTWGAMAGLVVGLLAMILLTKPFGTTGTAAGVFVGHLVWAIINQIGFLWLTAPGRSEQGAAV